MVRVRKPLGPRSSGAQLWSEVERLRRSAGDTRRTVAKERFDELASELERARAREGALIEDLRTAREAASEEGLSSESIAGKPALSKLRRTWSRFAGAVMRLPILRRSRGLGGVRLAVSTDLMADLDLFELDAPHGRVASLMRDRLRRQLTHPALMVRLASDGSAADYHRTLFLAAVARYYLRPSVWRTYDKASDEGVRDALGTVYK